MQRDIANQIFLFYPVILILGICVSYTDIRFKKIKNNHILWAIIAALAIYTYLVGIVKITLNVNLLINLLIGFGIGFLLYLTDVWGAGDAKLFVAFCLLMPTEKTSQVLPFAAFVIFINIFLLSTLAILALSLGQIIKNKNLILKRIFSLETLNKFVVSFLIIFALGWLIGPLTEPMMSYSTPFLMVLFLYFLYLLIYKLTEKLKNNFIIFVIFGAGLISRFLLQPKDFAFFNILSYLKMTLFYALIFYTLHDIFELNKPEEKNEKIIPFAPLILLGTLAANTNFIYWVMRILNMASRK